VTSRTLWVLSGLTAGVAGLATSYATAMLLSVRESPVVAVGEAVIDLVPGDLAEQGIQTLGHYDKPVLIWIILVAVLASFAGAGLLARRRWAAGALVFVLLAVVGGAAVLSRPSATSVQLLPLVVGLVTWLVAFSWLTPDGALLADTPEYDATGVGGETRRGFLIRMTVVGVAAAGVAVAGELVGAGRRRVERARGLLRLSGVTKPQVPRGARLDVDGLTPWATASKDFYQVHTAIALPTVEPVDWELRIHGMVDRELTLSYADLLERQFTEAWITLNCVSNVVGGDLIGNAWWSGVRVADLLAEAGAHEDADAVLQTSEDGWTCGTPLVTLTDTRNAMLAVAMNGEPLPLEHGFPVRTIVPGLYGYVSACKWVVDMEVTRFDSIEAYWTSKGWGELGPVKLASRIDVPSSGDDVTSGPVRVAGVAWAQHTGISAVEVSLDGGGWQPAELAAVPTNDTWVQWVVTVDVGAGEHQVKVRAIDKRNEVQTGVERDVLPDGATGWHTVDFTAEDA
jgi:DMSO/TMAO reductase YedYZ molybdopterin-dependent catalytic subunit